MAAGRFAHASHNDQRRISAALRRDRRLAGLTASTDAGSIAALFEPLSGDGQLTAR